MTDEDHSRLGMSRQTRRSVLRTLFYAVILLGLLLWRERSTPVVSGLVMGLLFGDYLTWLIRTLPTALTDFVNGAWQTAVNVIVAVVIVKVVGFAVPRDAEEFGVSFVAFMTVLCLKIAYYAIDWVQGDQALDGQ